MAYFSFARKIMASEPIDVFGEGQMARDFTYVDDIIDGLIGVIDHPAAAGEHRLFNIGDSRPVGLLRMIEVLEQRWARPPTSDCGPCSRGMFRPLSPMWLNSMACAAMLPGSRWKTVCPGSCGGSKHLRPERLCC